MNNYIQADQQLHRLSQIIAKANRSFVQNRDDDSHTNLGFSAETLHIEGRWIITDRGKIRLNLRLTDVCFIWQDSGDEIIQTVSTAKKEIAEIERQLCKTIKQYGLDESEFLKQLHFDIPNYAFTHQPVALLSRLALNDWIFWRTLANQACVFVLDKLNTRAEIRIWPHHFDTGIHVEVNEAVGIGFGLAMKDDKVNAPYFYSTCHPKKGELDYSKVNALNIGEWLVDDWKGAVLSMEQLQAKDREHFMNYLKSFINESIEWYLS